MFIKYAKNLAQQRLYLIINNFNFKIYELYKKIEKIIINFNFIYKNNYLI